MKLNKIKNEPDVLNAVSKILNAYDKTYLIVAIDNDNFDIRSNFTPSLTSELAHHLTNISKQKST